MRDNLFVAILGAALINGLFSPFHFIFVRLILVWWPDYIVPVAEFLNYAAALTLSTATLLISGVPAALYEKVFGGDPDVAMYIWVVCIALFTVPSVQAAFGG
ncbi:MAG: hypothetical protein OHK0024_07130 [Thalassobaculales bacterium]